MVQFGKEADGAVLFGGGPVGRGHEFGGPGRLESGERLCHFGIGADDRDILWPGRAFPVEGGAVLGYLRSERELLGYPSSDVVDCVGDADGQAGDNARRSFAGIGCGFGDDWNNVLSPVS